MKSVTITPRYSETDQMGIIYHGNYFSYFELGRTGLMREGGYTYSQFEKDGFMLPVIEVGCKYKKPLLYDEPVRIDTSVDQLKGVRVRFRYVIHRASDDEVLAEGFSAHAFVDLDLRPVRYKQLPETFRKILEDAHEG
jgi:acyl-CoA thioester hydrolase